MDEIQNAIMKMKNNKSPGFSGVTTDMLKCLPEEGICLLDSLIQNFWTNHECDYNSWHLSKLTMLYKGKEAMQDPNNWRGIYLNETTAKIVRDY